SVIHMIFEALNKLSNLDPIDNTKLKLNDYVAAKDVDNYWYRAKVLEINKINNHEIAYLKFLDFGNEMEAETSNLAQLPTFLNSLQPQCSQYKLGFIKIPFEVSSKALEIFKKLVCHQLLFINIEYTTKTQQKSDDKDCTQYLQTEENNNDQHCEEFVTLKLTQDNIDVTSHLLKNGLAILNFECLSFENSTFEGIIEKYRSDELYARRSSLGYWQLSNQSVLGSFVSN
ncbi:MAG: nuclease domain-containing protein, partial [Paramarteilia canceri]